MFAASLKTKHVTHKIIILLYGLHVKFDTLKQNVQMGFVLNIC
jgi:hypothetical protein